MRAVLALLFAVALSAVEVPATVLSVTDGDTIRCRLASGAEAAVRLVWLDTPESRGNAHGPAMIEGKHATVALRELLMAAPSVRLWGPGLLLKEDQFGRKLALVLLGDAGEESAQECQVRAGWSVYWRKYGEAPEPWHARLVAAQAAA